MERYAPGIWPSGGFLRQISQKQLGSIWATPCCSNASEQSPMRHTGSFISHKILEQELLFRQVELVQSLNAVLCEKKTQRWKLTPHVERGIRGESKLLIYPICHQMLSGSRSRQEGNWPYGVEKEGGETSPQTSTHLTHTQQRRKDYLNSDAQCVPNHFHVINFL